MGCARHPSADNDHQDGAWHWCVCNSNCPKELTYLGQHPTFTRPFVLSIIPSPSYFPSLSSHECSCRSSFIYHCKQHCCVIMVLGASEHLLLACPYAFRRACVCVCVCACVCVCVWVSLCYRELLLHLCGCPL